jgi:uncharacterized protein YecT (DUF1311 family)
MKMKMTAIALLLAPGAALADDKVDCTDPQVQIEMNYCAEQDYKAADTALNAAYKTAMAAMKETDSYLPEDMKGAADALLAAQRAWIPYRDKACASAGYVVRGGSMEPMIIYQCMARITKERTAELNDLAQGMGN